MQSPEYRPESEPGQGRGPRTDVLFYTRQGCHLCDEALAVLVSHGLHPRVVDVDVEPGAAEQYGDCVPVVLIDGKLRFRGAVNPVLLRRLIK